MVFKVRTPNSARGLMEELSKLNVFFEYKSKDQILNCNTKHSYDQKIFKFEIKPTLKVIKTIILVGVIKRLMN